MAPGAPVGRLGSTTGGGLVGRRCVGPSGATDGGAAGGAAGDAAPLALGGAAEGIGALGRPVAAGAENDEAVGAALDGSASPPPQPAVTATATSRIPTAGRLRIVTRAVCPTSSGGGRGRSASALSRIRQPTRFH
ncbi:hypothetical protein Misp05_16640 [Micromonospora sp. NBRC 107095]|nr:hypothetical protein Misp05_16640 [Micromonospora sp. NBRC 107095]